MKAASARRRESSAVFSQFASAIAAAMNTVAQSGGVMPERMA